MSPSRRFHFHSHSRRSLPPDHALSISLTVSISPSLSRSLTLTVSPPASLTLTLTLTSHFVEAVVVASLCLPGFLPASLDLCESLIHDELFNSRGGSVGSGDSSQFEIFLVTSLEIWG
uniref:Uncharacterized protein n=1 Tax=Fagus sylvatica TaxID=28930 RepID=A0A2N9H433_FAGSY